jgi:hypothetical protein
VGGRVGDILLLKPKRKFSMFCKGFGIKDNLLDIKGIQNLLTRCPHEILPLCSKEKYAG